MGIRARAQAAYEESSPVGKRPPWQRALVYAILCFFTAQTVYPLIWLLSSSLKTDADFFNNIWGLPSTFMFENYTRAWEIGELGSRIFNSVLITSVSLIVLILVAALAAYALARMELPGGRYIFLFILASMMIPSEVTVIPLFLVVKALGLLNSYLGIILVYVASGAAFSIFLLRGFFLSIPRELEEAALVDGANHLQVFLRIVLPLSLPGLATVAVFQGMQLWNEFFLAFIFLRRPEIQTIPLGLVNFFSRYQTDWTLYFAALATVIIPVILLYVVLQRWFIAGLTAGALKG